MDLSPSILKYCLCFLCVIITYNVQTVQSSGVMEIRFHRFQFTYFPKDDPPAPTQTPPVADNSTESPWQARVPCPGPPAYRFILCLDSLEHSDTSNECSLGRVDTGAVSVDSGSPMNSGMDTIFFGSAFGRPPNVIPNPMPFNFPDWPGGIRVKVYISCCPLIPRLQDECREELMVNYTAEPGSDRWSSLPVDVSLRQRSKLWLQVNLYCDANFFGHNCSTHCTIDDPTEHFMCNHLTGERECTFGWEGDNCDVDIDECTHGVCQNDAGCTNSPGKYECLCQPGFTGLFCQYRTPGCPSNPCQNNGSCMDTDSGYVCSCSEPWTGDNCENDVTTTLEPIPITIPKHSIPNFDANKESNSKGENHWYIIVIAIVVTAIVAVLLIICVIWGSRRKKYEVTKGVNSVLPEQPVPTPPPREPSYDNNLYMSGDHKVSFSGPIPFGNGIFSNIGFDVPQEDPEAGSNAARSASPVGATGTSKNDFTEVDLKSEGKKSKRLPEPRGNVYVPWVPPGARHTEKEQDSQQMAENDLSAPTRSHEPVSSQLSNHYAVSRPISELRNDLVSSSPTGSLFSVNRFRKKSSTQISPKESPCEKRKISVGFLMEDIIKWSPRSRKSSSACKPPENGEIASGGLKRNKSSYNLNKSDTDLTRLNVEPDYANSNYQRRRSAYELFEPSPINHRMAPSHDEISLSSNSSVEINIPINIKRSSQSDTEVDNQYVHMSSVIPNPSQTIDPFDSRRPSGVSTVGGASVNTSPVVSESDLGSSGDEGDLESNSSLESMPQDEMTVQTRG